MSQAQRYSGDLVMRRERKRGNEMMSVNAGASGQFKIGDIAINRLGYGAMRITGPGICPVLFAGGQSPNRVKRVSPAVSACRLHPDSGHIAARQRTDARPPARTPSQAFARAGSVPSAHGPAQREIGLPSVGCHCVRAPGTKCRAARAVRRAASRAPVRWPPRHCRDRKD
jgi:hypothetical protein